jgi:hypothetical protein
VPDTVTAEIDPEKLKKNLAAKNIGAGPDDKSVSSTGILLSSM